VDRGNGTRHPLARLSTGRHKVLSAYRSYHGATATSINLTGDPRRWPNDTGSAGVVHFFGPFLYRSAYHANSETQECQRALENLEETIRFEGPTSFAAIVLETIPVRPASWCRRKDSWPGFARSAIVTALSTSPMR